MNSIPSDTINSQSDTVTFTVPITAANHRVAEKFYQQHSGQKKARQVYLNSLSVQAVQFYLSCLGIETSPEQSQSWNTALQVLVDTADLWVHGLGHLECRPMLADMEMCFVPSQVWSDRIGYVVVRLNLDLTEATLLGFAPKVETEQLPLEQLQPLDQFPEYLNGLAAISAQAAAIAPVSTVLSRWLDQGIETSWKTLELLMADLQAQPALSFRTSASLRLPEQSVTGIKRGKFLVLGNAPEARVLFLMEIMPGTGAGYQIKMELYPAGKEAYLPRSLHVSVMDEAGNAVLQAENSNSEGLEFQFSGEPGEQFSVRVSLDGLDVVEVFEI